MAFRRVSLAIKEYDYRLSWKLKKYQNVQEYSKNAGRQSNSTGLFVMFGALGGTMAVGVGGGIDSGGVLNSATTSEAVVEIVFEEVQIHNKSGDLIADFGTREKYIKDQLVADYKCECAYYNVDFLFKFMLKDLAAEIEEAIRLDIQK